MKKGLKSVMNKLYKASAAILSAGMFTLAGCTPAASPAISFPESITVQTAQKNVITVQGSEAAGDSVFKGIRHFRRISPDLQLRHEPDLRLFLRPHCRGI